MALRYLRYFTAAANHLNLTRAAEDLGIAQPALSIQLRKLEEQLEVRLFERLPRGLRLTAAGEDFNRDIQKILALTERAIERARFVEQGLQGCVHVGFCHSTVFLRPLADMIRRYRAAYPGIELDPSEAGTPDLVAQVRSGRLDAAVIRLPFADLAGLQVQPILTEPMVIASLPQEPAAADDDTDLAGLAKQPLILFSRAGGPDLYDAVLAACRTCGVEPQLTQSSSHVASAINLVAGGFGWTIVPESIAQLHQGLLQYRPLSRPSMQTTVALVYELASHPAITHLAELIKQG